MEPFPHTSSSITELYDAYGNMLYRVSYAILLSKEDAEDAVADVFLKLMKKQPVFHDKEHEKAWLIRVTVNRCHDLQRRRSLRSYTPLEEMTHLTHEESQEYSVLEEVMKLPEKYKTVLVLFYFEDMTVEEIASGLRITKGAAKMRLSRGRELLKDQMKGGEWNA